MKRLALISFHTCPLSAQEGKEVGGMNVYVLELAKALGEKGYFVDIFTRDQGEKGKKEVEVTNHVRVIHILAGPQKSIDKKELAPFIDDFFHNVLTFIKDHSLTYDLIHAHYYLSGVIGLSLKEQLHIPLITTFHTLALMKNLVARSDKEHEDDSRIEAEHRLLTFSDLIISPSETDKVYMQYLYGGDSRKIIVITPGVNTKIFYEQSTDQAKKHIGADIDHKLLLFVGRIEPLKGIDVLLYSMKILSQRNPSLQVCLWIVGGELNQPLENLSEEMRKLHHLQKQLGLNNMVKFIERKAPAELPYYYNAADLVVAPSQYESFGITALEAMACGTPVITTDVTGVSDLLDKAHETLITSANNPLLLADQIERLLTDSKAYAKASEDVTRHVQDVDWTKVADKIIDAYSKVIKE